MKEIGSSRCQKKLLCLLTTGRLMGANNGPIRPSLAIPLYFNES